MLIYILVTFLSSFLSFSLQLMVGKIFLPWFGGSSSVWSTLLFCFISFLLLGYLYVFYLAKLNIKKQVSLHSNILKLVALTLCLSLFFYHKLFPESLTIFSTTITNPTFQIIKLFLISIGAPFLLLSTTSTLMQSWYSLTNPTKSPYFLYSVSNIGSLLGLVVYPFLVEPQLTLRQQELSWTTLFVVLLALSFWLARNIPTKIKHTTTKNRTLASSASYFIWTSLSGVSNLSLLATTTIITQSVSPSPFLWFIPLCLFLISYIIAFSGKWYQRGFYFGVLSLTIIVLLAKMNAYITFKSYWADTTLIIFTQFLINLVCHSELFASKPKTEKLTSFYLAISIGGVLGSILSAFIAPSFFKDIWEFPLSLVFGTLLYVAIATIKSNTWQQAVQHLFIGSLSVYLAILYFANPNKSQFINNQPLVYSHRNFYGVVKIFEYENPTNKSLPRQRFLYNGNISHGYQKLNTSDKDIPTSYYSPGTGVGQYLTRFKANNPLRPVRVGVVGLGTGALAGYCQNSDYYRFYEINPEVISVSEKYFSFVNSCKTKGGIVDFVLGDARLSLQSEVATTPQNYDLLAIDAFTDDAIPTHLLTTEAISLYFKHLKPDGVLAIHISNNHLKLNLVLDSIANRHNYLASQFNSNGANWYFLSKTTSKFLDFFPVPSIVTTIRPWTDDYSNFLQILK